jgi:hypothetical protein
MLVTASSLQEVKKVSVSCRVSCREKERERESVCVCVVILMTKQSGHVGDKTINIQER